MVHTFLKGISLKVNIIARLDFKLAYYDSPVQRFNHYTTRTPTPSVVRAVHDDSPVQCFNHYTMMTPTPFVLRVVHDNTDASF